MLEAAEGRASAGPKEDMREACPSGVPLTLVLSPNGERKKPSTQTMKWNDVYEDWTRFSSSRRAGVRLS